MAAVAQRLYRPIMDRSRQVGQQTITPVIHLAVEEITLHPKNKTNSPVNRQGCYRLQPPPWSLLENEEGVSHYAR